MLQYQIVPFFSHTSDFVTISSSTAVPIGDSFDRTSHIKVGHWHVYHASRDFLITMFRCIGVIWWENEPICMLCCEFSSSVVKFFDSGIHWCWEYGKILTCNTSYSLLIDKGYILSFSQTAMYLYMHTLRLLGWLVPSWYSLWMC